MVLRKVEGIKIKKGWFLNQPLHLFRFCVLYFLADTSGFTGTITQVE